LGAVVYAEGPEFRGLRPTVETARRWVPSATLSRQHRLRDCSIAADLGGDTAHVARVPLGPTIPDPQALDALLPAQMAAKAEAVGVLKARLDAVSLFVLAVLAGAFISLGAIFATTVSAGAGDAPFGLIRLVAGLAFSLGLILVIVGGAELFTGNTLVIMAWASGKVSSVSLLRNWAIVYAGNLVGAIATAGVTFVSGQYMFGKGSVGLAALTIGESKASLEFVPAIALGMLCNALVCLAVWLTFSARTTTDRILAIVPPIAAFVAIGFEHSVANMYFIPEAIAIRTWAPDGFWTAIGRAPADYPHLTLEGFLVRNLLPVSIGNVIGGAVMVGVVYWFVYLRGRRSSTVD
jgi:formate transporter